MFTISAIFKINYFIRLFYVALFYSASFTKKAGFRLLKRKINNNEKVTQFLISNI